MKILSIFITLAFGAGVGLSWQWGLWGEGGSVESFTVQNGENFSGLAPKLERAGLVKNARALRWYVNLFPPDKSLKRGDFAIQRNMPIPALVRALTEGKPIEFKFTLPEGHNIFQVADALDKQGFAKRENVLVAAKSEALLKRIPGEPKPKTVEGYLFPETYMLQKVFTAEEILSLFVDRYRENWKSLEVEWQQSSTRAEFNLSHHELVTLASIVEKETGAAFERPLIASVFLNRLRKRMRLQTDPTIIYGLWLERGSWDGNIRRRDLQEKAPYNTYQISGLPPGPIANPGLNALKAVMNPASSDYLYFVSKNNGTHVFSKDYADHNRAVKETQLNKSARQGGSWRDLPAEQRAQ